MNGQIIFRQTNQKSNSGKDVFVIIGVVGLDKEEQGLCKIKDCFKYDILDIVTNNGEWKQEYEEKSPEDLLESRIWEVL